MLSEHEIQFHRSFLGLKMALAIWNEDYTHQNTRGGPPDRQRRRESDPVYAYHVHTGPHWPSKPPGTGPDKKYNALLARTDGSFEPLVITTKRGMTGQNFAGAATPWELTNSVLCGGGKFNPIVNAMMEVTGHYANVWDTQLIRPAGISFTDPAECLTNEVPLYLWIHEVRKENTAWVGSNGSVYNLPAPEGWESFKSPPIWNGGIDVLVLLNGEVIGAAGKPFQSNNGHAPSVMSPLDFWAPGSRLLAAGIRALTNRISAAAVKGFKVLTTPSKGLAVATVARLSGKTSPGMAVSTGTLPFEQAGRRTIIMGEDMAYMKVAFAKLPTPPKTYDVVIHGDDAGFYILVKRIPHPDPKKVKEIYRKASVREIANLVRPHLAPDDEIRLLACTTGNPKGPAQQLANELAKHNVWAPDNTAFSAHGIFKVENGQVIKIGKANALVPADGGKFWQFIPERGAAKLAGKSGTVSENEVKGVINPAAGR